MGLKQGQLVITSPQSAFDIRQLSTILLRRRLLILGVSCVVMSVGSLLALIAKPTYQSYMQILVSSNLYEGVRSSNLPKGVNKEFIDPNFEVVDYTTQLKLMLSSKLMQKTVNLLLSEYPDITVEDIKGSKNQQGPLIITQVEPRTGVNKVESQVFEVSFKDKDAVKAQKVLQTLQKVYQDYNIEQQKERLSKGLSFFNERLPKIKSEVIQAEKNLEQFRNRHNLLDPEVQGKILLESLADIKRQLQTTRAQLQDLQARYKNLKQELTSRAQNALITPDLSQSRYQILLNEIQKTEMALAQEQLRYTDDSPAVQKLIQQRQSQVALLQQEVRLPGNKTVQASSTGEPFLMLGQMAGVDLKLKEELIKVQTAVLGLHANEKSLAKSEQQIASELSRYPSLIAEYNRLLPEVQTNRKTLEQLMVAQQSTGIKIAQAGFDWQVLEEPQQGSYLGSSRSLLLLGGALIGPILGLAAALILEIFNNAIYSSQDLQRLTNLRLLGTVPKLPRRRTKKRLRLPFGRRRTLTSSLSEAIASLPSHATLDMAYQNIQILGSPLPCKSLMLTSARPGEGKSTLALGLAVSAAHMHRRVLLIDANLREPSLHKILELSNDWGLSLLLVEETNTPQQYIQPIHPSIDVLTAGPTPEDPVKLLSSERMKELLELFEQTYDLVLIDTPPILGMVDARILASLCNAIVMVGRIGQVTRTEITQATEILSKLNLIGIIANEAGNSTGVFAF